MTEPVVQLEQWRAHRNRGFVIGPVDLSLDPGTVLAVMGPSGIGKSTLLMTMLGYQDRELRVTGRRSFWGAPAPDGAVPDAALYIPQAVPFNPNWEVEAFLLRLPWTKGLGRTARRDRVRSVLARLELTDRRRATIAELSGGEAQRAALAQVLLMRPRLLVGDEFVAALDPGMSLEILNASRDIVLAEQGVAVFAMHSVETALAVSDIVCVFFPNPIAPQPILLHRGSDAWKPDWLHALLTLSRSLTGVRSATLANLVGELERGPCDAGAGRPADGVVWCDSTPASHLADPLLSRLGSEQAGTMFASFDVRLGDARIVGVRTAPHASSPCRVLAAIVGEDH